MQTEAEISALQLFNGPCNCAQAVFAACASDSTMTMGQRLAIAAAFGGGLARQGETCGALTGALMAIGELCSDAMAVDFVEGRKIAYAEAGKVMDQFREKYGTTVCHELTGCRLNTEQGRADFAARGLHDAVCNGLVVDAVAMVKQIGKPEVPEPVTEEFSG
jgi:C_GCAxxG_C_C family probable redox protein